MTHTVISDAIDILKDSPETLESLNVEQINALIYTLVRNGMFVGVYVDNVTSLQKTEPEFSLLRKNGRETKELMSYVNCAFDRSAGKIIDTVVDGSYSHYESLLQNELALAKEESVRLKNKTPYYPFFSAWLHKSEIEAHHDKCVALARYERHIMKVIDELQLMYDTYAYPAFSARVAYEALLEKRPACFHAKSNS